MTACIGPLKLAEQQRGSVTLPRRRGWVDRRRPRGRALAMIRKFQPDLPFVERAGREWNSGSPITSISSGEGDPHERRVPRLVADTVPAPPRRAGQVGLEWLWLTGIYLNLGVHCVPQSDGLGVRGVVVSTTVKVRRTTVATLWREGSVPAVYVRRSRLIINSDEEPLTWQVRSLLIPHQPPSNIELSPRRLIVSQVIASALSRRVCPLYCFLFGHEHQYLIPFSAKSISIWIDFTQSWEVELGRASSSSWRQTNALVKTSHSDFRLGPFGLPCDTGPRHRNRTSSCRRSAERDNSWDCACRHPADPYSSQKLPSVKLIKVPWHSHRV